MERETAAGIREYCSDGPRIEAVFKARYSDFQVNEISSDGRVAELKNPEPPTKPRSDDAAEGAPACVAPADWDRIAALADSSGDGDGDGDGHPTSVELDAALMDKEERKRVHDAVKRAFRGKVVGSTVTLGDRRTLTFAARGTEGRKDARRRWEWSGDFVHFVLYKENRDTMDAAGAIADRLRFKRVDPAYFGYCGTKDKRAKTSQWFSIKRVEPERIVAACRGLRDVAVGDFSFCGRHLKLGDLRGNRFRIALRNLTAERDTVERSLDAFRSSGFVNYFGLQRFGSRVDVPTYAVGRHILKENYEKAVKSILEPHGKCYDALERYRRSGDAAAALADFRGARTSPEAKLLKSLSDDDDRKDGRDPYVSALNSLPRNMRLLYVHSYQSWVWNRCVSERLARFGLKCHPGDLVPMDSVAVDSPAMDADEVDSSATAVSDEEIKEALRVKALTPEDVESGKYTMFDTVMPLPGFNVEYPSNLVDYYETLLGEDGLKKDLKNKNKGYSLGGAYRRVLAKPEQLSWKFVKYSDPTADLIESDLDALKKKPPIADSPDGKYTALLLTFDLPSSTYATMALRELLKMDTCGQVQALGNDYHKDDEADSANKRKNESEDCESNNKKNKSSD